MANEDEKKDPLESKDPLVRAQGFLQSTEGDENLTPELALFLAHHLEVSYNDLTWLNGFPFREQMSEEDWLELWQKTKHIVYAYWEKFHGPGKQAR